MILTYFNVSFSFFLHSSARDPGLGPKAVASRAQAGPLPPLWGLGLGSGPENVKKNEKDTLKYNETRKNIFNNAR